jgi:hypothetical protein
MMFFYLAPYNFQIFILLFLFDLLSIDHFNFFFFLILIVVKIISFHLKSYNLSFRQENILYMHR